MKTSNFCPTIDVENDKDFQKAENMSADSPHPGAP